MKGYTMGWTDYSNVQSGTNSVNIAFSNERRFSGRGLGLTSMFDPLKFSFSSGLKYMY